MVKSKKSPKPMPASKKTEEELKKKLEDDEDEEDDDVEEEEDDDNEDDDEEADDDNEVAAGDDDDENDDDDDDDEEEEDDDDDDDDEDDDEDDEAGQTPSKKDKKAANKDGKTPQKGAEKRKADDDGSITKKLKTDSKKLTPEDLRERSLKSLFLTNLPVGVTEEDIAALSSDITLVKILPKRGETQNAFVEFENESSAEKNHKLLQNKELSGNPIGVDFTGSKRQTNVTHLKTLRLTGLAENTNQADLIRAFPLCIGGRLIPANIQPMQGFVDFESHEDAQKQFDELKEKLEIKGSKVTLEFAGPMRTPRDGGGGGGGGNFRGGQKSFWGGGGGGGGRGGGFRGGRGGGFSPRGRGGGEFRGGRGRGGGGRFFRGKPNGNF